ncbi:hypothetical protein E2C01_060522 [Portunus trituberculatus]|uniref:Uncharacterized protein n=1 Tax=Portunus trituberculatus TaxID=210409 RepID=A0A5B7H9N9_PORTR|nr:hypothetical protein [Portunus trituberculatus]
MQGEGAEGVEGAEVKVEAERRDVCPRGGEEQSTGGRVVPRQDHPVLGGAVTEAGVGSGEPVCGDSVSDDHGVNDFVGEEPP